MKIHSIYTSTDSGAEMIEHSKITAIADAGLEGDRYATGKGHYSGDTEWDAHVTLMQIEPFNQLRDEHGIDLDPKILRRNLIVESIDLNFLIGDQVVLETRKLWPPCSHIVNQTGRTEIFEHLAKATGIGASIIMGGEIKIGDPIYPINDSDS